MLCARRNLLGYAYNNGGGGPEGPGGIPSFSEGLAASYPSIVVFGDSITVGANASVSAARWANIVTTAKSATLLNSGIGGTWWQNSEDASLTGPTANNGRDRFQTDILGASKRDMVIINYGYNEARYTQAPSTANVTNFIIDARETLNGCIIAGYQPNKIVLGDMYWVTDARLANTDPDQTRAAFEEYVTAIQMLGTEYGCFVASVYSYMRDNGGDALIDGGDVPPLHPGDVGHAAIAVATQAATRTVIGAPSNVRIVGTAAGALNFTWDPVASAASYELQGTLKTGLTFPNTGTSSSPSGSLPGLAAGDYVGRVRAVFGDGSKGSWVFNNIPVEVGATLFLNDSFNGSANGTAITSHTGGETGNTWALQPVTPTPGTAVEINSGRVRATSATGSVYQASPVPPTADYEVTTWVEAVSNLTAGQCGPAGRMQAAADTFYYARYVEGATPQFSCFKRVAGTVTQLGVSFSFTIPTGSRAKLTLRMQGTTIKMLVDDVERVSVTDSAIAPAGKAGVRLAGVTAADTGCQLHSVYAKAL